MTSLGTVVIAGAGIGGLTAAIALARRGFRVSVIEQAEHLQEIGAGIQLSPNASRVLIELGLRERLQPLIVVPEELKVWNAHSGLLLASARLGHEAEQRYGAPYWVIHRGDLHAVLREAAAGMPLISLQLGMRVEDFAVHSKGLTVAGTKGKEPAEAHGSVLIGADGLWSALRGRLGHRQQPRFARHVAWRALVPADEVSASLREAHVNLWLGRSAHVVHYPVRGGRLINVVAIRREDWRERGWNEPAEGGDILARFAPALWQASTRELIAAAERWQKWALHDCAPLQRWGTGPVTLLGDAAHPMLPYLAQGAAMAVEDAAVLAQSLARRPDDPALALRHYEDRRRNRAARTQRAARRNGLVYRMGGADGFLRTLAQIGMRSTGLLRPYDWLYRWKPE